ncbi:MAG: hypothetical protein ACLP7A_03460 [Desulfobaccales bacterium]
MADKMREKNAIILCGIICITLIICGVLFWPTPYRYDKTDFGDKGSGQYFIRVNRFTGYAETLYKSGWESMRGEVKDIAMPQDERDKVKIKGYFHNDGWQPISITPATPDISSSTKQQNADLDYIRMVRDYANQYGIRPDVYLSILNQESQLNPNPKSETMLKIGAGHLADLYNKYGNWAQAVKAYNGGSDPNYLLNVGRQLRRAREQLQRLGTITQPALVGKPEPISQGHIIPKDQIVFDKPSAATGNYKGDIYNGTSWTINKLRLSIGAKDKEGKIQWQKAYEVSIYIEPFSIGSCSIKLMDSNYFTPNAKADALGASKEKEEASREGGHWEPVEALSPEVKVEEIWGYKGD